MCDLICDSVLRLQDNVAIVGYISTVAFSRKLAEARSPAYAGECTRENAHASVDFG